jgi:hypothetical protein
MLRRLAKPAAVVLAVACVSLATQPAEFIEAVTANLASLIDPNSTVRSLTEGDKTFSNFTFDPNPPVGTATVPSASNIFVTATTVEGMITLIVPIGISARTEIGALEPSIANVSFGFDVSVAGSDAITGVTVQALGDGSVGGPGTGAITLVTLTGLEAPISVTTTGQESAAFPGPLKTLDVDVTADAVATPRANDDSTADTDILRFVFEQTTPAAPVPEPGSLTLLLGGLGILVARGVYRRLA